MSLYTNGIDLQYRNSGFQTPRNEALVQFARLVYLSESTIKNQVAAWDGRSLDPLQVNIYEINDLNEDGHAEDEEVYRFMTVHNSDYVVVAFRGTHSTAEIVTDGLALGVPFAPYGEGYVHYGFKYAVEQMKPHIETAMATVLKDNPDKPIYLTGHSLGGAQATLAALMCPSLQNFTYVATFGQPAVGNSTFNAWVRRERKFEGRHMRFVNDRDIVPCVPPILLFSGDNALDSTLDKLLDCVSLVFGVMQELGKPKTTKDWLRFMGAVSTIGAVELIQDLIKLVKTKEKTWDDIGSDITDAAATIFPSGDQFGLRLLTLVLEVVDHAVEAKLINSDFSFESDKVRWLALANIDFVKALSDLFGMPLIDHFDEFSIRYDVQKTVVKQPAKLDANFTGCALRKFSPLLQASEITEGEDAGEYADDFVNHTSKLYITNVVNDGGSRSWWSYPLYDFLHEHYTVGGQQYRISIRSYSGSYTIHAVNSDASLGDEVATGNVGERYTTIKTFSTSEGSFLFLLRKSDGYIRIHKINEDGTLQPFLTPGSSSNYSYNWSSSYTNASFYTIGDQLYLVILKRGTSVVRWHPMNADGTIASRIRAKDWSNGWSHYIPYEVDGVQYRFLLKEEYGHVSIRELGEVGYGIDPILYYTRSWGTAPRVPSKSSSVVHVILDGSNYLLFHSRSKATMEAVRLGASATVEHDIPVEFPDDWSHAHWDAMKAFTTSGSVANSCFLHFSDGYAKTEATLKLTETNGKLVFEVVQRS